MPKQEQIEHALIPKHKKISEKEKKELFEKYCITFNDLPSIHKNDPALAGIEVEIGDVIRIERDSLTAKKTLFYRGVING
jgi:DNA-directed RNA polymerase subunit H